MVPHALGELQDPSPWSGPTRVRGGSSYFSWPTANSLEDLPRGLYICGFKSCQVIRTCDLATLSAAQFLLALKCLPPVTWSPTSSYPHSRTGLSSPSVPSSPSFPLPFSSLILLYCPAGNTPSCFLWLLRCWQQVPLSVTALHSVVCPSSRPQGLAVSLEQSHCLQGRGGGPQVCGTRLPHRWNCVHRKE